MQSSGIETPEFGSPSIECVFLGCLKDSSELEEKYAKSIEILCDWMQRGIAAGVYTQTTDVECEVNGLLSYDRKVQKLKSKFLAEVHSNVWQTSAQLRTSAHGGYHSPEVSKSERS